MQSRTCRYSLVSETTNNWSRNYAGNTLWNLRSLDSRLFLWQHDGTVTKGTEARPDACLWDSSQRVQVSCALLQWLWVHMNSCPAVSRRFPVVDHAYLLALTLLCPSFPRAPLAWGGCGEVIYIPFSAQHTVVSFSLYSGQLWVCINNHQQQTGILESGLKAALIRCVHKERASSVPRAVFL